MTHLQQTCAAMATVQALMVRIAAHQRIYLARGDVGHAEAAKRLLRQHREDLAYLGHSLMLHAAANDATTLPGAA